MKIVIDIEDIPKNDHERYILSHGTPLEKVLEDIKAEIETEYKEYKVSNCRYGFGLLYALKVIEKHIAERGIDE